MFQISGKYNFKLLNLNRWKSDSIARHNGIKQNVQYKDIRKISNNLRINNTSK